MNNPHAGRVLAASLEFRVRAPGDSPWDAFSIHTTAAHGTTRDLVGHFTELFPATLVPRSGLQAALAALCASDTAHVRGASEHDLVTQVVAHRGAAEAAPPVPSPSTPRDEHPAFLGLEIEVRRDEWRSVLATRLVRGRARAMRRFASTFSDLVTYDELSRAHAHAEADGNPVQLAARRARESARIHVTARVLTLPALARLNVRRTVMDALAEIGAGPPLEGAQDIELRTHIGDDGALELTMFRDGLPAAGRLRYAKPVAERLAQHLAGALRLRVRVRLTGHRTTLDVRTEADPYNLPGGSS